jgi:hypothetical protein
MTRRLLIKQARQGLGDTFTDRDLLERLVEAPFSYLMIYRAVRRALVRDFPYSVFFLVEETRVVVLAALHQMRDPAAWPKP